MKNTDTDKIPSTPLQMENQRIAAMYPNDPLAQGRAMDDAAAARMKADRLQRRWYDTMEFFTPGRYWFNGQNTLVRVLFLTMEDAVKSMDARSNLRLPHGNSLWQGVFPLEESASCKTGDVVEVLSVAVMEHIYGNRYLLEVVNHTTGASGWIAEARMHCTGRVASSWVKLLS